MIKNPGNRMPGATFVKFKIQAKRPMQRDTGNQMMSENKGTVEKYIDGFRKSDHEQILSCLTDDVEWEMPGLFHHAGKNAFDKEIENEAFEGSPTLTITRMVEENDVVVAEGSVQSKKKGGDLFHAVFCDVFVMRHGKIKHLITYLNEVK